VSADRTALFLDIDGTLVEYRPRPEDVTVDEELRDLLVAANHRLGGAIAFITGRMIEHVDRLFDPLRLPAAGVYGQEIRLTHHGNIQRVADLETLRPIAETLIGKFGEIPGVHFERKGSVLAIHTRAAPHALRPIVADVEDLLRDLADKYHVIVGNAGLEILPVGVLKSAAIERFMAVEPFASRAPVFVGDDASDESGFRYVNERGGVSVRVFPRGETDANYVLKDVVATRKWLAALLD
jgi:trehalose 6-phosphate phosphatase